MAAEGDKLHWEDIEVGQPFEYGAYPVTKDEIFAYAHAYDPQPHHIDEAAAMLSLTKGLCASGWHSCAMFMRVLYDGHLKGAASLGAPGIDEVKWLKPVRPGHVLSARSVCTEKRVMSSRPHVGICRMRHEILNQHGEVLMIMENAQLLAVRHPAPAAGGQPKAQQGTAPAAGGQPKAQQEAAPAAGGQPKAQREAEPGVYFEDLVVGRVAELGAHHFPAEEIKAFARTFDPQAFHLDEEAARQSLFGGLCASGWHTASVYTSFNIKTRLAREAALRDAGVDVPRWGPSPGFKNLKWPKPVFAGDTITFRQTQAAKVDLKSRPERGLSVSLGEGFNQKGELVYQVTTQILVPRRVPLAAAAE